ncbi:hypothetical protein [Corynebacterium uberis]|uniref:6PGD fold domain-containing protein n=1 Tax=Corynebacterium uberis TaxID=2883169 RepID=UPI001D09F355|nr:hypothetical protein [Corynebacterium uberis]UDL75554.1 hypothetical protein LH393_10030 [Corynebacterium uberis]
MSGGERPPRMRVAFYYDESTQGILGEEPYVTTVFAEGMRNAGHSVTRYTDIREALAASADALVLTCNPDELPQLIEDLAPRLRPRQILIHTCFEYGTEIFDPLAPTGVLCAAIRPLDGSRWIVNAPDEIGAAVARMMVTDLNGLCVFAEEDQVCDLHHALTWIAFSRAALEKAADLLGAALPGELDTLDIDVAAALHGLPSVTQLELQYQAITDPGVARAFLDLTCFAAEEAGNQDAELWARQERNS